MSVKLSARGVIKLYFAQKWRCEYCAKVFTEKLLPTADHKISRNSPWSTNGISNICLACESCNLEKWDMSYEDFLNIKNNVW